MKIRIKYINAMILSFIKNILNSFDSESQEFRILIYQTNINRARIFFSIIFLLLTPLLHFDYQRIQNITDNNLLGAELLFYAHIGMTIVSLLIVLFCLTIYSKLREYNEIGKHFFYVLLFTILNLSAIVTLGDIILGVGISNYIGTIMLFSFVLYLTPLLSGIFYLGNSTILFFLTISLNIIDGHQKQSILINLILYGVLAFFASLYFFNLKKRDYQLHKDMEESEQLYKDIFNISPDPMVIHDGEKILQTNLATLQATGIKDINDIIGSDPMRFLHPDDRKKGRERSKIMLKTSSSLGADEFVFIGPENKNLTVIVRPRLIKYNNKNAILVHYHDITVQKNREKELAESNKSSIILNDILKSVNSSATIDELYNSVHTSLNEIIDARNFFIAILTDDRTKVIFPYYRDDYDKWMETEGNRREVNMSDHNSMTARLMQNKQPVLWHKSEIIEQFGYDDSSEYGSLPDQWLGVPLKIQELLIGCLVVQIYKNENPYTQNDLLFMESVADTIAPAFERIIAETAINESRKKYKDLFEKSADANLIIENGLFIDCNQAALDMLGITSKIGLLPIRPQEISPETQPDGQNSLIKSNEMIQIALDQGSNRFEWEHIRKNGESFPVEILLTAIHSEKKQVMIHTVWRDITEKKKTEAAMLKNQRLGAIGEMASAVAHDFNNALQSIFGNLELATLEEDIPEKISQYLHSMKTAAEDAGTRVQLLQRFGGKKQKSSEYTPTNMNQIIDDVILQSRPLWKDKAQKDGLKIKIDWVPEKIPMLQGNEGELRSVLYNIIKNSIEAMSNGGTIKINALLSSKQIITTISDTGKGMSEDVAKRIFQPLFSTKGFETGRGFGMSGAYTLIKEHKGQISVKSSQINQGTSIEIILPIIDTIEKVLPIKNNNSSNNFSVKNILWVEDDEIIRTLAKKYLEILKHNGDFAENGKIALELLDKNTYDLIISDIGMPEMTGWQLAEIINKQYDGKLKIALLTGWAVQIEEKEIEKYNIYRVLGKPVKLAQLRKLIEEA